MLVQNGSDRIGIHPTMLKFRTNHIFWIFHICKTNIIMLFCNLFIKRPSYLHLLISCFQKQIGECHLFRVDHLRSCSHAIYALVHDWHHVTLDIRRRLYQLLNFANSLLIQILQLLLTTCKKFNTNISTLSQYGAHESLYNPRLWYIWHQ